MTAFAEAEQKIGYVFKDKELLTLAFTHSTYSNVHGGENNERLEYLGDAVLQLVVSELLYACEENGRKFTEGEMTEGRQRLVNQKALSAVVEKMGLKEYLLFEGGASNVGEKTTSSLFETVAAAIYLDGGFEAAKKFVFRHLQLSREENYIGKLQIWLQKRGKPIPDYGEAQKSGADHAPVWTVTARADGAEATGTGKNITAAQQEAAKKLLSILSRRKD